MPVQLSVKVRGAELVRQGLEDIAREAPRIGRKRIYDMMRNVLKLLRTPGKKPSYPINWDSDRQRRYVLAMLRAQDNLPYRRTDALPRGWEIVSTDKGYRLENPAPAAVYVYGNYEGERQSRIHEGRHPIFQEVVEEAIQELPPDIEEHITYYARQRGM